MPLFPQAVGHRGRTFRAKSKGELAAGRHRLHGLTGTQEVHRALLFAEIVFR